MEARGHRRAGGSRLDPRLLLLAAFVVGALLAGATVAIVTAGTEPGTISSPHGRPEPSAVVTRTVSTRPSAAAAGGARMRQGLMTKPLTQLAPGDRVVYNMRACTFRGRVGGDVEVSLIACPGQAPFQVRTVTLVPVEPSTGD